MPTIKEHVLTIQQKAADNQKEHTRKEHEDQLETIMVLYDLMMVKGPDVEIDLENGVDFLRRRQTLRTDGVLSDLMKDMDDQRLLDAIKAPEDFRKILNQDYKTKAAANRKERIKQEYLDKKQEYVDKFDKERVQLMSVYGPEGKMPTDVAIDQDLIDEFGSIKLDIPEGMDKETAMCIIMGCCLDMKNLIIADPAFETADQNSINFAREVMIHELLISDDRPTSVPKAMVEGKKDAQKVFDAYRNNNKEPAKAALNNIIEHHSHMIADDNASFGGNSGAQLGTNKILDIIMHEVVEKNKDLGLDYNLTNLLKIQQYE